MVTLCGNRACRQPEDIIGFLLDPQVQIRVLARGIFRVNTFETRVRELLFENFWVEFDSLTVLFRTDSLIDALLFLQLFLLADIPFFGSSLLDRELQQVESVFQQVYLHLFINFGIGLERGRMVNFDKPGFQLCI